MLGVWIELPILDALCNRLNHRASQLWFYMMVNTKVLPLPRSRVLRDLKMHKDVFNRSIQELKEYGLAYYDTKSKCVDFFNHEFNYGADFNFNFKGHGVTAPLQMAKKTGIEADEEIF